VIAQVRARGYRRLIACALRENAAFSHLAHDAGFVVESAEGAAWRWALPLDESGERAAR
jgi:L-amino acid N-acyltransferase YncA